MTPCIDRLKAAVLELDRMRATAVDEGCPMLALTLQLARDEAEEELARRNAMKRARAAHAGSTVIRFPRRRLARRRKARAFAEDSGAPTGELLSFADHASRLRA
jgi:hypothetical protein